MQCVTEGQGIPHSSPTQTPAGGTGYLLRPNKPLPALCSKLAQLQEHTGLQASSTGIWPPPKYYSSCHVIHLGTPVLCHTGTQ